MKEILKSVQELLVQKIPGLNYVEKNQGQLEEDMPVSKLPCALIDIEEINYTQQAAGRQMAEVPIVITVAQARPVPAWSSDEENADPYLFAELLEDIHNVLQRYGEGDFSPLCRTSMQKVRVEKPLECYSMTHQTTFHIGYDNGGYSGQVGGINLNVK
ncbi:MAG: hypothetical protein LUF04_13675 [Bacteroides sp.]|nr:hypothetical protein [Bacteroides sp.]